MPQKIIENCKIAHTHFMKFFQHVLKEHRLKVVSIFLVIIFVSVYFITHVPASGMPAPMWNWAQSFGSTNGEKVLAVTTDSTGNSYIVGHFDGPSVTIGTTVLNATGDDNLFVAKYKPEGRNIWIWPADILERAEDICQECGKYEPEAGTKENRD